MKAELKEVLEMIDRLNPGDLAIIQEKIAPSQKHRLKRPDEKIATPKNDVFSLSFEDYLALADDEREDIQWRAYQLHQSWADAELNRRGAQWLLVCHGEIIEASSTWRYYPSRKKLMAVGKQNGYVPFVYVKAPLIEESQKSFLTIF
jgi:hypothetical protein